MLKKVTGERSMCFWTKLSVTVFLFSRLLRWYHIFTMNIYSMMVCSTSQRPFGRIHSLVQLLKSGLI